MYHEIDIEQSLHDFKILKLTDFASTICYVPLETDKDILVTNLIKNIFVEDDKLFVSDAEPCLKVFDAYSRKF